LLSILSIFFVVALIIVSYILSKRKALTCPKCKNKICRKTGEKRNIPRAKRALIAGPFPVYEYQYQCIKCNHIFWSSIESIYSP
jgi:uncharacterized protein with PIN domain